MTYFFAFALRIEDVGLFSVSMKKKLFTILQYIIFLGLGIFLAWWSLKDLNREEKDQITNSAESCKILVDHPCFCHSLFKPPGKGHAMETTYQFTGLSSAHGQRFFCCNDRLPYKSCHSPPG